VRVVMVLGRSTGGIGTHVVELVEGLRAEGDRVTVVTDAVTADRFGIADAKRWWPGRAAGVVGSVRRVWWLRGLARHADVVHAHGHQAGLVAALAGLGLPTPLVVSQHNAVLVGGTKRRLLDVVQRFVARRAALVSGASSDLVEEARRRGAREARLAEVPSPRVPRLLAQEPLDEHARHELAGQLFREAGVVGESLMDPRDQGDVHPSKTAGSVPALVLTIARIAPQKDLGTLVSAASLLPATHPDGTRPAGEAQISFHLGEKPAVWVVVGGGDEPLRAELERRAAASGAPVHLVGAQDDPERWLRAADVFVLPSLWEARALVVQEAMAAGVPVVATDTGGLRDLVEGVGTLVPVGDAAAVADAVGTYLREPATRHTASVKGRERAASWDDGAATARRWQQWYSALLPMT
jgi:glycosyltransferase involved in cell wall biosynthesis